VHGLARHPGAARLTGTMHQADITDRAVVDKVMAAVDPVVVIHTAALASVNACEANADMAVAVNVHGAEHVARAARGRRLIFISTDSAFDGTRGSYTEDDVPTPLHVYARTKMEAERRVLALHADALAVRTSFYGWNVLPRESLSEWILNLLHAGQTVQGFTDVRFSPLLNDQLARLLLRLAALPARGVLNVGSRDGISKWDFACRLATAFGYATEGIVRGSIDDAKLAPARPKDVTLDVTRATTLLGRALPSVDDGIAELRATMAKAVA
jgi:dTDP-4-dehydrorhamnose reductase